MKALSPWSRSQRNPRYATLAPGTARLGAGLAPPTDDRPFFFKMDSTLLSLFQFVTVLTLRYPPRRNGIVPSVL
jgi:hypothetical protein